MVLIWFRLERPRCVGWGAAFQAPVHAQASTAQSHLRAAPCALQRMYNQSNLSPKRGLCGQTLLEGALVWLGIIGSEHDFTSPLQPASLQTASVPDRWQQSSRMSMGVRRASSLW